MGNDFYKEYWRFERSTTGSKLDSMYVFLEFSGRTETEVRDAVEKIKSGYNSAFSYDSREEFNKAREKKIKEQNELEEALDSDFFD